MNATTTVSLIATTTLFTSADSETPSTSSPVTAAIAITAGRFTTPVPAVAPETKSLTGVLERAAELGRDVQPEIVQEARHIPGPADRHVAAASPYSRTNSTPMIHAASSPSDA